LAPLSEKCEIYNFSCHSGLEPESMLNFLNNMFATFWQQKVAQKLRPSVKNKENRIRSAKIAAVNSSLRFSPLAIS